MDSYLPSGFAQIFETATKEIVTQGRIRAVLAAYDQANEDPNTDIPRYLHHAIEALRRV